MAERIANPYTIDKINGLIDDTIIPALNEDFDSTERVLALKLLQERVAELKARAFIE